MSFLGQFNIGTDLSLVITNNNTGAEVTLDGRRTKFEASAKDTLVTSEPSDNGGLVDHRVTPKGWEGSIEVDRNDDDFSELVSYLDAQFYTGAPQTFFTISSFEPSADKTVVNQYQHKRVVFHGYKPGSWDSANKVTATVQFACQQRVQVS